MTLNELKIGDSGVITAVGGEGALRCRPAGYGTDATDAGDTAEGGTYGGPHRDTRAGL